MTETAPKSLNVYKPTSKLPEVIEGLRYGNITLKKVEMVP